MAAPMVKFRLSRLSQTICNIIKCSTYTSSYSIHRRCLHGKPEDTRELDGEDDLNEEEELQQYEDEISKLRDVSNLSSHNRRKMRDEMPMLVTDFQKSRKFQRKMYMSLGEKSGLDPRLLFPSDLEIDEMIEDEKEWEPKFHDTMQKIRETKAAESKVIQDRETLVAANMAKMDGWIADYRKKKANAKDKELQQEKRRESLLDEAYEYYGYRVTRKTTEFVEFMEKRAETAKLEKIGAKKKEKLDKVEADQRFLEALSSKKKTEDTASG